MALTAAVRVAKSPCSIHGSMSKIVTLSPTCALLESLVNNCDTALTSNFVQVFHVWTGGHKRRTMWMSALSRLLERRSFMFNCERKSLRRAWSHCACRSLLQQLNETNAGSSQYNRMCQTQSTVRNGTEKESLPILRIE